MFFDTLQYFSLFWYDIEITSFVHRTTILTLSKTSWTFLGTQSNFSKFSSVPFEELSLQRCKFQISVEMVKPFGCTKQFSTLQLPISYSASLIIVTITRHVFTNTFQRDHFSAVKFSMRYEKNMSFLVIAKSPKV